MKHHKLLLCAFISALILIMGCGSPETTTDRCDVGRRCGGQNAQVCGEDGKRYACESYAQCLGVAVDASGNACASQCPNVECDLFCPNGFAVNDQGCSTCSCKPVSCPDISCEEEPDGGRCLKYKTDEQGCQTCECEQYETCQPVACNLFCEFGFETDEQGCQTCSCKPAPSCPESEDYCQFCDRDDPTCQACCDEIACPDIACDAVECPNGYKQDANGCPTCECVEDSPCRKNEDCQLDQLCEDVLLVHDQCCPTGTECPPSSPPCPRTCVTKTRCERGAICGRGTVCTITDREDCCGPAEDCTDDIPGCLPLCQ